MEVHLLAKCIKIVQVAKAFLKHQGKLLRSFILEGFKGKGKAKVLIANSEQTGAKKAFKSKETVESNSDEEEEEKRVHTIKKIKREHVKEPIGVSKKKKADDLQMKVVPKMPIAEPLHSISKLVVLIPSMPKSVPKAPIVSTTPIAGPFTFSAPKTIAAAPVPKPVPVMSTGKPAVKGGSVIKNPFMVRQFKLAGTEESGVLIINQATEVSASKVTSTAIQETL
ncbi:hypothetical protein C0995_015723, partial [Termitomyces sp. Mi166